MGYVKWVSRYTMIFVIKFSFVKYFQYSIRGLSIIYYSLIHLKFVVTLFKHELATDILSLLSQNLFLEQMYSSST